MSDRCFLDTNVWIYAATGKFSYPEKYRIARDLISAEFFAISGQIIGEFIDNVGSSKKMKTPLTKVEIDEWLQLMDQFDFIQIDRLIAQSALVGMRRYTIRYWDSAMLAQAECFGAKVFYTEDLNNGQLYGSVRVVNPFLNA
jgi:predicted nucleic acid-binding protein